MAIAENPSLMMRLWEVHVKVFSRLVTDRLTSARDGQTDGTLSKSPLEETTGSYKRSTAGSDRPLYVFPAAALATGDLPVQDHSFKIVQGPLALIMSLRPHLGHGKVSSVELMTSKFSSLVKKLVHNLSFLPQPAGHPGLQLHDALSALRAQHRLVHGVRRARAARRVGAAQAGVPLKQAVPGLRRDGGGQQDGGAQDFSLSEKGGDLSLLRAQPGGV